MKFGMMNNPSEDPLKEIRWIAKNKLDFVDFTIELPKAREINVKKIKSALNKYKVGIVGHTAWYLPMRYPYKEVRMFALKEAIRSLKILHKLGSKTMNLHFFNPLMGIFDKQHIGWYAEVINPLIKEAKKIKMTIMLENSSGSDTHIARLEKLFKKCPGLKLHIDIGHANLDTKTNATEKYFKKFKNKIEHIHVSDNFGKKDDHVTLGKGKINWVKIAKTLKKYKYDKTITFEVFDSRAGLIRSKNYLKKLLK